jgi:ribonuclease Z
MATQVIMLGTGTRIPIPDRAGQAADVLINETPYLVDFGAGVIRYQ